MGKYNTPNTTSALIIGNGVQEISRSNAFRFEFNGNAYGNAWITGGADYAEMFEWQDGNPLGEDRAGYFVTLEGKHIRKATPQDGYILGVVTAAPSVVGDCHGLGWRNMYQRDKFGRVLYEWAEVEQTAPLDEAYKEAWRKAFLQSREEAIMNGAPIPNAAPPEKMQKVIMYVPKINPDYDPNREYISRDERKEWSAVGMMGKLIVLDDGSCAPNGYCTVGKDGIATASGNGYRVLERLGEDTVRIVLK